MSRNNLRRLSGITGIKKVVSLYAKGSFIIILYLKKGKCRQAILLYFIAFCNISYNFTIIC